MSGISEGLGIIHRAGCQGPSIATAMPYATMYGRNPYFPLVADGKGGEVFQCRLCGMIEGQVPDVQLDRPRPGPELVVTREQVEAKRNELTAKGKPHGYDSLARALNVSRATIRRRLKGE